eukprot:scaffold19824_cov62-Cyclotella_meneghiniana.AAC.3
MHNEAPCQPFAGYKSRNTNIEQTPTTSWFLTMSFPATASSSSSVSSAVTRASMLERQRQVAMRRRQNQLQHSSSIDQFQVTTHMTRVQMMNSSPQIYHQTDQMMMHGSNDMHQGMNYNPNNNYGGQAYVQQENNLHLPMTQMMLPANAFPHHPTQQMIAYDGAGGQGCHRNSRYSNKASRDDISELTDTRMEVSSHHNEPPRYVSMEEGEKSTNRRSTFSTIDVDNDNGRLNSPPTQQSHSASKLRRSNSTRSLSFKQNPAEENDIVPSRVSSSNASRMSSGSSSKEESQHQLIHFLNNMESIHDLNVDDPTMMRLFLTRPCPKRVGMMRCYIKRNKGIKNKLFPEYRVYLKENNAFVMTSKKRMGNATSNYLISMGRNDFDNRQSPNVIGKLRSNFLGTEYQIYDDGRNPQYESSDDDDGDGKVRSELGVMLYASATTLGSKGPRKIKACIGKIDDDCNPTKVWQPMNEDDERMVTCFKNKDASTKRKLLSFVNKPPSWNDEIKAYSLNFNGRVTVASVKNFQLIDESDSKEIYLQFGKTGKDEFIMDFQYPLSPLQAFAFTLSSFDSKLGCD